METFTEGVRVPVNTWLPIDEIEPGALAQIKNTANHPEAYGHVAIMPDCHQGFGVTIGTAFATEGSVIPNAVGVDIGCGVAALDTGLVLNDEMGRAFWQEWAGHVRKLIPTGFAVHRKPDDLPEPLQVKLRASALQPVLEAKAAAQLGTLGGGNHFLEAAADERGVVWLLVHSGSRGTGNQIAQHYHRLAVAQSLARGLAVPADLASLRLDTPEAESYLHDMGWADRFASTSRVKMAQTLFTALLDRCQRKGLSLSGDQGLIDIPHNYAIPIENGLMLHRKGATLAGPGTEAIIPGSMGSPSYIVRGKADTASWQSCSHGAGRAMSRRRARDGVTLDMLAQSLAGTFTRADVRNADEAPAAYKDIRTVMARQADLVDVVRVLRPIITVKGDSRAKED